VNGLLQAATLRYLNLSNNIISDLSGLNKLVNLQYLNLSFNYIQKLDSFLNFHGNKHRLEHLDIRGNKLNDLSELKYMTGCNVINL
jgi:Leucine-rich repeat (LRR) protein